MIKPATITVESDDDYFYRKCWTLSEVTFLGKTFIPMRGADTPHAARRFTVTLQQVIPVGEYNAVLPKLPVRDQGDGNQDAQGEPSDTSR